MKLLYALGLLAFLAGSCSEQQTEQAKRVATPPTSPTAEVVAPAATADSSHMKAVPLAQLPAALRMPGQLLEAWRWTDTNGENMLVVFRNGPFAEKTTKYTDEESYVELFARQYVQRAGSWQQLWRLQDAVRNCPFDLWLGLLPGSTAVTDLDGDGLSETTLLYKLTCRSDVSPSDLKLIMHEGAAKYALRGQMVVAYDSVPVSGRAPANPCCLDSISQRQLNAPDGYELLAGRYESEKEFRKAPAMFLRFARQQWRKWSVRDGFDQF
ncbi:M949_RS01915 family surface polysaccharide biosynthesis protein [Hymenobacter wooponensis]